MKTLKATVRDSGEGEQRWFYGGGVHTWKATAENPSKSGSRVRSYGRCTTARRVLLALSCRCA